MDYTYIYVWCELTQRHALRVCFYIRIQLKQRVLYFHAPEGPCMHMRTSKGPPAVTFNFIFDYLRRRRRSNLTVTNSVPVKGLKQSDFVGSGESHGGHILTGTAIA